MRFDLDNAYNCEAGIAYPPYAGPPARPPSYCGKPQITSGAGAGSVEGEVQVQASTGKCAGCSCGGRGMERALSAAAAEHRSVRQCHILPSNIDTCRIFRLKLYCTLEDGRSTVC